MAHFLYRLYNGHGRLLYVGISKDPWARFAQHKQERPHMTVAVQRGRVQVFPSELEAKRAEREAIQSEHPVFNLAHRRPSPDWSVQEFRRYVGDLKAQPYFDYSGFRAAQIRAVRLAFTAKFGQPMGNVGRTNARTARP